MLLHYNPKQTETINTKYDSKGAGWDKHCQRSRSLPEHSSVGTARSVEAKMKMTVQEGRGTDEKNVSHIHAWLKSIVITKKGSKSQMRR